jgi:hypothetical protein
VGAGGPVAKSSLVASSWSDADVTLMNQSGRRSTTASIVGHSSQKEGVILDLAQLKCIDTYCYGGGWLTALDVKTGEVWQANERGEVHRGCCAGVLQTPSRSR